MFRGCNPQSVVPAPRRLLPTGDCGFVVYADPLPPFTFNAVQSIRCQCRSFWPNPHKADLCACGHHACYHSQEPTPPPTPSSPSTVLTIGAYASLMNRVSRLEQELDAQNAKRKNEITAYQSELKGVVNGLRGLDDKVAELVERMEEAEERLFGTERLGVEFEVRLNDLEVKSEEHEEELDALKDGYDDYDDDGGDEEPRRTKQEENHEPEPKELESRVVENTDEPKEPTTSKPVKAEPPEGKHQDGKENETTTTITTVIVAQPPFLKAYTLKRRLSESCLELHPTKKTRNQSDSLSS